MTQSYQSSSTPNGSTGVIPPEAEATVRSDLATVSAEAKNVLETVTEEGKAQLASVTAEAREQVGEITEKAKSFAAVQKDAAGSQLEGVATAIGKVADDLQGGDQAVVGGYARDLANGLQRVSKTIKSNDVDDIVGMVENFGRTQPLAFLGAAALAGFVGSRVLLSSAQRRKAVAARPPEPGNDQRDGRPSTGLGAGTQGGL